jgi:hypothetical protein
MKRGLLFLVLFLSVPALQPPSGVAPYVPHVSAAVLRTAAPVSDSTAFGVNSTGSITINSTGANFLTAGAGWYSGITADVVFNDLNGNSYNAGTQYTTGTPTKAQMAYSTSASPTVGSGHALTIDGLTTFVGGGFASWSGINAGGSVLSGQNGTTAAGTSTITTPSITCSENNCLYLTSLMFEDNSSGTVSINGGFTILRTVPWDSSTNEGFSWAYLVQGTAAAVSPQWNVTNSSGGLATSIMAFKGPGGGGGGATVRPVNVPVIIYDLDRLALIPFRGPR